MFRLREAARGGLEVELHTATTSSQASVEQRLAAEFTGRVPPEIIKEVAAEEVAVFDSARVRDYVPIFAWRQARTRILGLLEPEGAPARSRS